MRKLKSGFTLIELLVVLAALALLLSIAAPRYYQHVDLGREAVLKHNLLGLREAIDKFYADRGRYPQDLKELVGERYLREMPTDPMTERSDTWILVKPKDQSRAVADVHSGARGFAQDGTAYGSW